MSILTSGFFRNYRNLLLLLLGMLAGTLVGVLMPSQVEDLKPLGDLFLNLLYTAIIPLIFFAIGAAIANIDPSQGLGRVLGKMSLVFLMTLLIAALFTILCLWFFPLTNSALKLSERGATELPEAAGHWGDRLVSFITVSDFQLLLSREHMLAFMIFAFLLGVAALKSGAEGKPFRRFLSSGNVVMKQVMDYVMKLAPIGLGAYFAFQVGTVGPQLFGIYARPMAIYYLGGLLYFFLLFSLYAWMASGKKGVSLFWKNNMLPSLTAISTCSSVAVIPANLEAAKRIGIRESVASVVIPLGATLHKDGSSISSIIKIAVAFALIGKSFMEPGTLLMALGLTILVSIVEGGIPNGGYLGELLMISAYQLPPEVIPAVMIIGTLVDPLATVLNATGDTVAAMMIDKWLK